MGATFSAPPRSRGCALTTRSRFWTTVGSASARGPAEPKKQAYRPPGARSAGGGLADLLRSELGSTSAESTTTATKVLGSGPDGAIQVAKSVVPGAAPETGNSQAAPGSRNAR